MHPSPFLSHTLRHATFAHATRQKHPVTQRPFECTMTSKASRIFVKSIPLDGERVPRPMDFYIGLVKTGRIRTERLIRLNGGIIHQEPGPEESSIIALVDPLARPRAKGRTVYSVKFVTECIKEGRLLNLEHFKLVPSCKNTPDKPKQSEEPVNCTSTSDMKHEGNEMKKSKRGEQLNVEHEEAAPNISVEAQAGDTSSAATESLGGGTNALSQQLMDLPQITVSPASYVPMTAQECTIEEKERKCAAQKSSNFTLFNLLVEPAGKEMHTREMAGAQETETEHEWSAEEDDIIFEIYEDAKQLGQELCGNLEAWISVSKANLLPPFRSAEECMQRCTHLVNEEGKRLNGLEDTGDERRENGVSKAFNRSGQKRERLNKENGKKRSAALKEAARKAVAGLAQRAGVSKKRAFRALRKERGNVEKAVKTIMGKK